MKPKILITGGNGYIATSLKTQLNSVCDITTISRTDFDLCDTDSLNSWFSDKTFDAVMHAAAAGGSRLKTENHSVRDQNLKMYRNLSENKSKFGRLIHFGSGAEFFHQTFYSKSKQEIAKAIQDTENFYNIRIFGVFDEDELDTRFIKANINRYLNQEPMVIHTNRIMDFFYMKDLVSLVYYYITNLKPNKEVNCSYETKHTLKNIATLINSLGNHKVSITVQNTSNLEFYCGESNLPKIDTFGLEAGIQEVYQKLFMMRN